MGKSRLAAEGALIAVVALWGWTFVTVKDATESVPVFTFLALRFTLAAIAFAPLLLLARRKRGSDDRKSAGARGTITVGVAAGGILALGYGLQTFGLTETTSGRSGVITGVSVALVPIGLGTFFRQKVGRAEWTGVVLALLGFLFLGIGDAPLGSGDFLVLGCAVAFAAHVILLGRAAKGKRVLPLAAIQVSTAAALFIVAALFFEGTAGLPRLDDGAIWRAVAWTGIGATTLGFAIQTRAQQVTSPTRIALILALEPVFALAAGHLGHGESLGLGALVGSGLVLAGMLCAELSPRSS